MAGLLQKAKAMAAANKAAAAEKAAAEHHAPPKHVHLVEEPIGEGLPAPASPGKAMAQTFLREPVRIVHLARHAARAARRDPVTCRASPRRTSAVRSA